MSTPSFSVMNFKTPSAHTHLGRGLGADKTLCGLKSGWISVGIDLDQNTYQFWRDDPSHFCGRCARQAARIAGLTIR